MIIQKQDLYGEILSSSPQNDKTLYIKWYQIMNIQEQYLYCGNL